MSNDKVQVTLSSGVVLELERIPRTVIAAIQRKYNASMPQVPRQYIEDKGREEENPLDPAYLQAVENHQTARGQSVIDAQIAWGTKVVSRPDGVGGHNDQEWAERCEAVGIEIAPVGHMKRYVQWVNLIACQTEADVLTFNRVILEHLGVREEAVADAMESFPGVPKRRTDMAARRKKAR
jgi:hypothetical protein